MSIYNTLLNLKEELESREDYGECPGDLSGVLFELKKLFDNNEYQDDSNDTASHKKWKDWFLKSVNPDLITNELAGAAPLQCDEIRHLKPIFSKIDTAIKKSEKESLDEDEHIENLKKGIGSLKLEEHL